jgi:hypothetical protein
MPQKCGCVLRLSFGKCRKSASLMECCQKGQFTVTVTRASFAVRIDSITLDEGASRCEEEQCLNLM